METVPSLPTLLQAIARDDDEATKHLDAVASLSPKAEKLAWKRKEKKMQGFVEDIGKIEDQILALVKEKMPLDDEISELREIMVKDCIHQKSDLAHLGTHIVCKFCERKLSIPRKAYNAMVEAQAEDAVDEVSE
jgi:hypothetical protein